MSLPPMQIEDRPHTAKEVADLCNVHYVTVRRWVAKGEIQTLDLPSGTIRIPATEVRRLVGQPHTNGNADRFASAWNQRIKTPYDGERTKPILAPLIAQHGESTVYDRWVGYLNIHRTVDPELVSPQGFAWRFDEWAK